MARNKAASTEVKLASAAATLRRLEKRPNANSSLLGSLRRMIEVYRGR